MRKLSSTPKSSDFLNGFSKLMQEKLSSKYQNFNDLLSSTRKLAKPIELQTRKLVAQGEEIMKRQSTGNVANALKENAAFKKEIAALMKKFSQTTSQVSQNVQKRRATAVRSQMKKKRAGQDYHQVANEISIIDALNNCLNRLVNIPVDLCRQVLGNARCAALEATVPPTTAETPTTPAAPTEEDQSTDPPTSKIPPNEVSDEVTEDPW